MRDDRFRDSIPNLVGKLFRRMARVHGKAVRGFEISAVQANILASLWLEGPLTMGEVQRKLALGSSTLTGAIDRMEQAQLVRRAAVPGDRRASRLEPAAWPARKKEMLLDALAAAEDACFAGLTAAERRELARLMGKALAGLQEVDDADEE